MPDGHIVCMQIVFTNRAQHHFARVNADAHEQWRMPLCSQRIGIAAHRLLHPQGGIERSLGMIFMGKRRAKERKDAIAQCLRDIAVIAMHGVHHELQSGINNRPRLFGIKPFD